MEKQKKQGLATEVICHCQKELKQELASLENLEKNLNDALDIIHLQKKRIESFLTI